jgi:hypothetical protein
MVDELIWVLVRDALVFLLRLLLFPLALLLCTPFILGHAAVLACRGRGTFRQLLADDYSSVDVYWWN